MRKKGFTLIELLVVIAIIAMLMAILLPALSKVKKIAMKVICGTNLKGMGTAQTVYANDYNDNYVVQGNKLEHTWSDQTDNWMATTTNPTNKAGNISVGASLYMLVREADVSPKSFVCPSSDQKEFSGKNTGGTAALWISPNCGILETAELIPNAERVKMKVRKCASAIRIISRTRPARLAPQAQGQWVLMPPDGTRSAAFAVMADKNPFFDTKLTFGGSNCG